MASGAIEFSDDGTLQVRPKRAEHPQGLADAVSRFAERLPSSDAAPRYRLSAASVWRGRRLGLSLETMIETLERHSGQALPPQLRDDLARWSGQIDRLRLEAEGDRLILSGANPLVITAVMSHRTLGPLVAEPLDAMRVELRAEAYPDLMTTFDACGFPALDQTPTDWAPSGRASDKKGPRARSRPLIPPVHAPRAASDRFARLAATPFQCQALTTRGRQCKNRVRPPARYCRVHGGRAHVSRVLPPPVFSERGRRVTLDARRDAPFLTQMQIAWWRVVILMGIGLLAWLGFHLLQVVFTHGLGWPLPSWLMVGLAGVLACGVPGRLVGLGVLSSLGVVGLYLLSIALDCLHKEGLILNLCCVAIPVLLPLWGLSQLGWSWAWVFVCFPVGLLAGEMLYAFLDGMST